MKKAVIVYDTKITRQMLDKHLSFLKEAGYEMQIIRDWENITHEEFQKLMLDTELHGPEGYAPNPEILEAVRDAEILTVHFSCISKAIIDAAKNLKVLGVCRGGCDNVNVAYAKEKGILCVHSAARSSDAVADTTVALMIAESKNLVRGSILLHQGGWANTYSNDAHTHNMRKMTVGIIGCGLIGSRVATRLHGFGARILGYDPWLDAEAVRTQGIEPVSFDTLLSESDMVTIHLRLSEQTAGFMGEKEFAKMKEGAFFINTARAGLMDEDALVGALKSRHLAGAAIDVYSTEPISMDHPYLSLDNITLTPHIAGYSCDTVENSIEQMGEELRRYVAGKPMCHVM